MSERRVPLGWAGLTTASLCLAFLGLSAPSARIVAPDLPSSAHSTKVLPARPQSVATSSAPRSTEAVAAHRSSPHADATVAVVHRSRSAAPHSSPTVLPATTTEPVTITQAASTTPTWSGYLVAPDAATAIYAIPETSTPPSLVVANNGSALIELSVCGASALGVPAGQTVRTTVSNAGCSVSVSTSATTPVPYAITLGGAS